MVVIVDKASRRAARRVYVTLKDSRPGVRARGFTIQNMTVQQVKRFIELAMTQHPQFPLENHGQATGRDVKTGAAPLAGEAALSTDEQGRTDALSVSSKVVESTVPNQPLPAAPTLLSLSPRAGH